jgi:hypothetical protein
MYVNATTSAHAASIAPCSQNASAHARPDGLLRTILSCAAQRHLTSALLDDIRSVWEVGLGVILLFHCCGLSPSYQGMFKVKHLLYTAATLHDLRTMSSSHRALKLSAERVWCLACFR